MENINYNKTRTSESISKKEWQKPRVQKIDFIHKLTLGGSGVRTEGMDTKNTNKKS